MKRDQLTFWGSRNIVGSIPENTFPKKASFIWEIPDSSDIMRYGYELLNERRSDANSRVSRVVEIETQVLTIVEDVREL